MKVRGHYYKVRVVPESQLEDGEGSGQTTVGDRLICIADHLSSDVAKSVLEHEIGHAACEESGACEIIKRFVKSEKDQRDLEELLVTTWLPVYLQAVKGERKK